jgi:polyisoprenoid-binding protein YceI
MRNILIYLIIIIFSFTTFSCKKAKVEVPKAKYSIETKTTTINWTAYKTTAKLPVKGVFKEINISNGKTAQTPKDVLNGLEFSIPVSSIDSKDPTRDAKLVKDFFGTMKNTQNLTGKIKIGENGKGSVNLTMNGITFELPLTYIISGQLAEIEATMNLDNWQAKLAIETLNKVCNEKHKGEDGISKTWNEVNLHIVSYLKVE